jgi:hypothetical protein
VSSFANQSREAGDSVSDTEHVLLHGHARNGAAERASTILFMVSFPGQRYRLAGVEVAASSMTFAVSFG